MINPNKRENVMKSILKTLIPCLALLLGFSACYDEMDDKAAIDRKYALTETPSLTVTTAFAVDFSTISVAGTVSSVDPVVEVGFAISPSADFSGAKFYPAAALATSLSQEVKNLAEKTTYYVKVYAMSKDNRLFTSEASTVVTPAAPRLSTELLDGKHYVATGLSDYWGDPLSFDFTLSKDAEDETKIWFNNLSVYFASNGFTADKGVNRFYGILDVEAATITLPLGQPMGYKNVVLMAFNHADPDVADGMSDLIVTVNNFGASLTFNNAFGYFDGSSWYELYKGGFTIDVQ